ncbi:Lambda C [Mahlapitsi orthoreovirus]|uniref:Lambda C n=1 Tax=Mahlapitsi orthoreovirus TaxID=2170064 RepID=A0A3G1DHK4_9REOV|nr:Lambda C [Mahlapitsi orthoreovirus]AMU04172.1 Lambda C [Mahlapitsi orthoreovirus]
MARFFGVRLADTLSCPTAHSPVRRYVYDDFCEELKADENKFPWIPLINTQNQEVVAVQLLRPLQGAISDHFVNPWPSYYSEWKRWMISRLNNLLRNILNVYPVTVYHGLDVNPIIANLIVAAFLNGLPFMSYIPFLFVRRNVFDDVIDANLVASGMLACYHDNYFVLIPGMKYYAFKNYSNSPFDPCLFSKDKSTYATGYYYRNYEEISVPLTTLTIPSSVLVHIDRPTASPHFLVPTSGNNVDVYGQQVDSFMLLMLEAMIQQFYNNSIANPAKSFHRLDECYMVLTSQFYEEVDSFENRVFQLSVAATNGYQLMERVPRHPTIEWVSRFITQIKAPGVSDLLTFANPRYVPILANSPSPLPSIHVDYYRRLTASVPLSIGSVFIADDAQRPVQALLQYTPATIANYDADHAANVASTLPITPEYDDFWVGKPLFTSYAHHNSDVEVLQNQLPDLPSDYFSHDDIYFRALFNSYRGIKDKSYHKDLANLQFVATLMNADNKPYLTSKTAVLYMGASGTHPHIQQPTVIKPWTEGALPGVPKALYVRQVGYDVVFGRMCNVRHPLPIGTFPYIYSDVDQVVDAGDDLYKANRVAIDVYENIVRTLPRYGSFCMKVNFPTAFVMSVLLERIIEQFHSYAISKPMINNNVEVYVHGFGKLPRHANPDAKLRAGVVLFLRQLFNRYKTLKRALTDVPKRGVTDDGTNLSGILQINLLDTNFTGDQSLNVMALAGLARRNDSAVITYATRNHFGSQMVTITGIRSKFGETRQERMMYTPVPILDAYQMQSRSIPYKTPVIFGDKAGVWRTLAMFFNEALTRSFPSQLTHLCDLGTGPEARILTLMPSVKPLTLIDVRPFSESNVCWATETNFLELDYLQDDWSRFVDCNEVSCILSLGAACVESGFTVLEGLENVIKKTRDSGAMKLLIQLNCNMFGNVEGVPGELIVHSTTGMYEFLKSGRIEPYVSYVDMEQYIEDNLHDYAITWMVMTQDLGWLDQAFSSLVGTSTEAIETARHLSQYLPLLLIDFSRPGVETRGELIQGHLGKMRMHLPDDAIVVVYFVDGARSALWSHHENYSYIGRMLANYHDHVLEMDWQPTINGLVTLRAGPNIDELTYNLGSVIVQAPATNVDIEWPQQWDFSDTGTDIKLRLDGFYDVRVYYGDDVNKYPVNPSKYSIIQRNQNDRIMTWVVDRSDAYHQFWLLDTQSDLPGQYISVRLDELTTHLWPESIETFLSPPDLSVWQVIYDDEIVANFDKGNNVVPEYWERADESYAVDGSLPTFYVPAGVWRINHLG